MLLAVMGIIILSFNTSALAARDWVNVKDFGAVGDGVKNDTVAIQKAIDSLGDAGGTVYIPRGNYFIGMSGEHEVQCPVPQNFVGYGVQLRSNITIVGDGPKATIFRARHMPEEKQQYSVLVAKDVSDIIIEKVGVIFSPLPVDPKEKRFTNEYAAEAGYKGQRLQSCIDIRYSKRITVRDVYVERGTQGISLFFGNSDILIDGIRAHNCYGCGVGIYSSVGRAAVTNSIITDCSDGMLSSYGNAGETEFLNNRVQCTDDNQRGDKYTQLITIEMSRFVKVIGNHCEGGVPAIDIKRTRDTLVTGNTVRNYIWGITVRPGDYAGGAGYSWRTIISNNQIENGTAPAGALAIQVTTGAFTVIEGNMISNNDGDAISVDWRTHYRDGNWPLAGRGVSIANNVIVRRTEEYTKDRVSSAVVEGPEPTPMEKWDPFNPKENPPEGLFNDGHRAIIVQNAAAISITGNVVRGGKAADWPHAGGIVINKCDGFSFTGNTIGDGNQGRGVIITDSSGTVSGNSIEGATEYALRLVSCKLISVTGNRISYRAKEGVALDVAGKSSECVFSANTISSDGIIIRERNDGKEELSNRNTFTGNRGTSTSKDAKTVILEGPQSIKENNEF